MLKFTYKPKKTLDKRYVSYKSQKARMRVREFGLVKPAKSVVRDLLRFFTKS